MKTLHAAVCLHLLFRALDKCEKATIYSENEITLVETVLNFIDLALSARRT
jgi:hypothetical protein